MEIVFNNVSYSDNKKSQDKLLDSLSLDIISGSITGFINDKCFIDLLLTLSKKPSSGELLFNGVSIKKTTKVSDYKVLLSKIGYVYDSYAYIYKENTVKEYINNQLSLHKYDDVNINKRVSDSLRLVGLNDSFIDKNPNDLSFIEQKLIMLAAVLGFNPDVIVLKDFEKGLSFREKDSYKKLFLKLKNKLNKTIIVITNDVSFMFDLVDNYYVINNGKLVLSGTKKDFYNEELYNYVEMPKIVEFTNYANSKGCNILEYTDFKELIKEIYRKV